MSRKTVWVGLEVDYELLADQLAGEMRQEDLLKFLLSVDAHVADTSFTTELIQNLQASLEDEVF